MKISIYQIHEKPIGRGGMGQVYLGTDPRGNRVAIKEMRAEYVMDSGLRARFHQEAQIMKNLEHPSIVKMFASFEENGSLYLVMEYVEGHTIEEHVRQNGPFPESEAVRLVSEILNALGHAHQQGFVHRDIKPSNIMVRTNGNACLLDFGIAKDMNRRQGGLTIGLMTIGTDGYMSPEQAEGYNIDIRSDIYSLGCVMFFMMTGHHAFPKKASEHETRISIINESFPKASEYNITLSDQIRIIMEKAANKNMLRRFQSCREFELELCSGATAVTGNDHHPETVTIGREGCDITIQHLKISRHHLDIERRINPATTQAEYRIRDRSTNGTLVGNQRLHHDVTGWLVLQGPAGQTELPVLLAGEVAVSWKSIVQAFAGKSPEKTAFSSTSLEEHDSDRYSLQRPSVVQTDSKGLFTAMYLFAVAHKKAAFVGALMAIISIIVWLLLINT